jgi:preprotein translocase subunit YajC
MQGAPQVNPIIFVSQFALIIGIFYFLLIRPQRKQEKEHQLLLKNLNKNDEVITSGGIHGTIVNVKDSTVVIRVDENVKIEIEKSHIATVKKAQGSSK